MRVGLSQLAPGEVLAGYRIEALLARGGMGVVYRATQLALERPVALKLIGSEFASDERFRSRFQREAKLAAALEPRTCCPCTKRGEADGMLFLVMRLVEGASLARGASSRSGRRGSPVSVRGL